MLLVSDGIAVCRRDYESLLDTRAGHIGSCRKDDADGALARTDCRRRHDHLGCDLADNSKRIEALRVPTLTLASPAFSRARRARSYSRPQTEVETHSGTASALVS